MPRSNQEEPLDSSNSGDRAGTDENTSASRSGGVTEALRDFAPYLDLGWRLAATAAVPPFAGFWIDVWLQTSPWALLAGCGLGLAAAILQLVQLGDRWPS